MAKNAATGSTSDGEAAAGAPLKETEVPGTGVIPTVDGGPGAGAAKLAEAGRDVHLRDLGAPGDRVLLDRPFPVAEPVLITMGLSPLEGLEIDPADFPGTHTFEALMRIHRDGRAIEPGEDIELDIRGYAELVAIGAVAPIDWETGEQLNVTRGRSLR